MNKVVHCKKEAYDIYIGRPSKWGNPFAVGNHGTRDEVVNKYSVWILQPEQQHLINSLHELEGKTLGCWCKPNSCHGDVLIKLLER